MEKIKSYDELVTEYPFIEAFPYRVGLSDARKKTLLAIYNAGFTDGLDRALELLDNLQIERGKQKPAG